MPDIEKDAAELLAKAKAINAARKPAEPKGAAPAPSAETPKTEEPKKEEPKGDEPKAPEDLEAQAQKDEDILSKDEKDLTEDEKSRKAEIMKVKAVEDDKSKKSNVQKRFDELTAKVKELEADRDATRAEKEAARAELAEIKARLSMTPQDVARKKVRDEMTKRRESYLAEDADRPREERREMSKEELDEWVLEDYEGAQEWISKRTLRRVEEERELSRNIEHTTKAEAILTKQEVSAARTFEKYPELNIAKRRDELKAQGKSKDETLKIICAENPTYKLCLDIYHENPDKYMLAEDGPELIVAEMEKRSSKGKGIGKSTDEVAELKRLIAEKDAEIERLKGIDDDIGSTRHASPKDNDVLSKEAEKLAREVNLDPKRLAARIKVRQSGLR